MANQVQRALFTIGLLVKLVNGLSDILPETFESINKHNSACYGTHTHFRPECPSGSVIGIQAVKVGAKQLSLNCPRYIEHDGVPRNDTCCTPDNTTDCIFEYTYAESGIGYKFHELCSGHTICREPAQVVRSVAYGCNLTKEYLPESNYMYMEYACINKNKLGSMCADNSYSVQSGTFYLQNPGYPDQNILSGISTCMCHVQAAPNTILNIYTLDMRLENPKGVCGQSLKITARSNSRTWNCATATLFNVTKFATNWDTWITLTNTLHTADNGYLWIGVLADNGSLQISCNVSYSVQPASSSSSGPSVAGIVGAGVGCLILLSLLICLILCCSKKKKRRVVPDDRGSSDNLRLAYNSPMPKKTSFKRAATLLQDSLRAKRTSHIDLLDKHPKCIRPAQHLPPIFEQRSNIQQITLDQTITNKMPPISKPYNATLLSDSNEQQSDLIQNITQNTSHVSEVQREPLLSDASNQELVSVVSSNVEYVNRNDSKYFENKFPVISENIIANDLNNCDQIETNQNDSNTKEIRKRKKRKKKKRKKEKHLESQYVNQDTHIEQNINAAT